MIHKNIILLFLLQLVPGNSHQWAGHLHAGYSTKNMTLDKKLSVEHEFLCLDGCFFFPWPPPHFALYEQYNNNNNNLKLFRIRFINVDK